MEIALDSSKIGPDIEKKQDTNENTSNAIQDDNKDVCLCVAGSVDSGKSSFIGVITTGQLDDGKGLARATVAKHPHEVKEGKTSDISTRTIKYGNKNITLVDLCGHEKYLKTTLFGITGLFPDYAVLIVSANRGLLKMTKEHMGILLYMKIPFVILVTRVDITPKNIYQTVLETTTKLLKRNKRDPEIINSVDDLDLINDTDKLHIREEEDKLKIDKIAKRLKLNPYIVPIISMSNKTGYYVDVVKHLLHKLEPRKVWNTESVNGSLFYIDSKFTPLGIGLVVSGLVKGKEINSGTEMLIGPYGNEFKRIRVKSMHNNNKELVNKLGDRQRGCLAIKPLTDKEDVTKANIRKGMIVMSKEIEQNICYQFSAEIEILNHSTVISPKYTPVIHCGTVRQSAKIVLEEGQNLKMGDRAIVKFRFVQQPEFMEKESIFFFREGTTRGVGIVKDILALKDDPNPAPAEAKRKKFHKQRRHGQRKTNNPPNTTGAPNIQNMDKGKKLDRIAKKANIEII